MLSITSTLSWSPQENKTTLNISWRKEFNLGNQKLTEPKRDSRNKVREHFWVLPVAAAVNQEVARTKKTEKLPEPKKVITDNYSYLEQWVGASQDRAYSSTSQTSWSHLANFLVSGTLSVLTVTEPSESFCLFWLHLLIFIAFGSKTEYLEHRNREAHVPVAVWAITSSPVRWLLESSTIQSWVSESMKGK